MRVLVALGILAGCVDDTHVLSITVTTPEGDLLEERVSGVTSWLKDEQGKVSASWPAERDIGDGTVVALQTALSPYQPGTTQADWTSLTVDGVPYTTLSDGASLNLSQVRWTGDRHFPFVQKGTVDGDIDGFAFSGKFDLGPADCDAGGAGCGALMADLEATEAWTIDTWTESTCPNEVLAAYIDGGSLVLSVKDGVQSGEAEALGCVVTDKEAGRVICGADDVVKVGGCKWAVTAVAAPGGEGPPSFAVYAGSIGACDAATCGIAAVVISPG